MRTVAFWYRQKYQLSRHDPRFLSTSYYEMLDDFEACRAYDRMIRGEVDEQEYDSGLTEDEVLQELDSLDGMDSEPNAWAEIDPIDLLRELDQL